MIADAGHELCLGVDIRKKLKEFSLDIGFETGKGMPGNTGGPRAAAKA
ncbi:MAG: hypothetical protein ACLTW9_25065 [Enterocloster sp.]